MYYTIALLHYYCLIVCCYTMVCAVYSSIVLFMYYCFVVILLYEYTVVFYIDTCLEGITCSSIVTAFLFHLYMFIVLIAVVFC